LEFNAFSKMKIAINTMPIGFSGGKDYAKMLIKHLALIDKYNNYIVFLSKSKKDIIWNVTNIEYIFNNFDSSNLIMRIIWEQFILPILLKKHKVDLLYNLSSYDIFLAPCKTIIKVGNMWPFSGNNYKFYSNFRLLFLRWIGFISFYTADGVIVMSNTARGSLISQTKVEERKFFATIHSADLRNIRSPTSNILIKGIDKEYILCVSNIYPYKKIMELIIAFGSIIKQEDNKKNLRLVIAGSLADKKYYGKIKKFIEKNNIEDYIIFLNFVPRNHMYELYRRCKFLVFPSTIEACPRTLIEALKSGVAILCSNRSVMPEICQDAALYFNPDDPEDIKDKLELLLNNNELIENMKEKSIIRGNDFSWEKTAKITLRIFNEVYKLK